MKKFIGIVVVTMLSMFLFVGCSGGSSSSTPKKGIVMKESRVALALNEYYNSVQLDVEAPAGATVDWTSSNSGTATVSSTGVVTAHAVGDTTITATIDGTTSQATCLVTVYQDSPIVITPTGLQQLYTGNTLSYQAFDSSQPGANINFQWLPTGGVTVTPQSNNTALVTAITPGSAGVWINEQGQQLSVLGQIIVKPSIEVLQPTINMVYGQSPVDLTSVIELPPQVPYTDVVYSSTNSNLITITPTATGGTISFNQLPSGESLPSSILVSMTIDKKELDGQVYKDTESFTINVQPPISCQSITTNHYITETVMPQGTQKLSGGTIAWSDTANAVTITNGTTATPTILINSQTSSTSKIDDTINFTYTSPTNLTYTISQPLQIYTTLGQGSVNCSVGTSSSAMYNLPIPAGWTVSFGNYQTFTIKVSSINSKGVVVSNTSTSSDPITGIQGTGLKATEINPNGITVVATGPNGERVTGSFGAVVMN